LGNGQFDNFCSGSTMEPVAGHGSPADSEMNTVRASSSDAGAGPSSMSPQPSSQSLMGKCSHQEAPLKVN